MARAVGELRPRYVLVENVANILALHDGAVWGEVLGDLAALRYNVAYILQLERERLARELVPENDGKAA